MTLFLLLVALIVMFRLAEQLGREPAEQSRFVVLRVIDGDTVELTGGDRLRLLAIDAPERGDNYYDEAIECLQAISLGRPARIEFGRRRRDGYGRLLGYLYINDLFANRVLVDSGWATVYLFKDNDLSRKEIRDIVAAQQSAIQRKVGVWSLDYSPEQVYINLNGSLRLHRPNCRSVAHRKPGGFREFVLRNEGLAIGLSPCRNCRP